MLSIFLCIRGSQFNAKVQIKSWKKNIFHRISDFLWEFNFLSLIFLQIWIFIKSLVFSGYSARRKIFALKIFGIFFQNQYFLKIEDFSRTWFHSRAFLLSNWPITNIKTFLTPKSSSTSRRIYRKSKRIFWRSQIHSYFYFI